MAKHPNNYQDLLIKILNEKNEEKIDLSNSNLTEQDVVELAGAIIVNTTLRSLNLEGNQLSSAGLGILNNMLTQNTTILEVNLTDGDVENKLLHDEIQQKLERNRKLQKTLPVEQIEGIAETNMTNSVAEKEQNIIMTEEDRKTIKKALEEITIFHKNILLLEEHIKTDEKKREEEIARHEEANQQLKDLITRFEKVAFSLEAFKEREEILQNKMSDLLQKMYVVEIDLDGKMKEKLSLQTKLENYRKQLQEAEEKGNKGLQEKLSKEINQLKEDFDFIDVSERITEYRKTEEEIEKLRIKQRELEQQRRTFIAGRIAKEVIQGALKGLPVHKEYNIEALSAFRENGQLKKVKMEKLRTILAEEISATRSIFSDAGTMDDKMEVQLIRSLSQAINGVKEFGEGISLGACGFFEYKKEPNKIHLKLKKNELSDITHPKNQQLRAVLAEAIYEAKVKCEVHPYFISFTDIGQEKSQTMQP